MRGNHLKSLLAAVAGLAMPFISSAAISIGAGGAGPIGFGATLPASEWTTVSIAGNDAGIGSAAALDTAVAALTAAGITAAVPDDTGNPPAQQGTARRSSTGQYVQTRATGNNATVLLAIFQNDSGNPITMMGIAYALTKSAQPGLAEQVESQGVYYSLDGSASSWVKIPALSHVAAGPLSATLDLSATPIAVSGSFYLLWADDNATGGTDSGWQIDNLTISFPGTPVSITQQPMSATVNEGSSVTFSVAAQGSQPNSYQWYENSNPIGGANGSSYTINPALRGMDNNTYYVVVDNTVPSSEQSATVTLDVIPDLTKPTILCAYQGATDSQVLVLFSEVVTNLQPFDPFNYEVTPPGTAVGASPIGITAISYQGGGNSGNTLVLDLAPAMTANQPYEFRYLGQFQTSSTDLQDRYGNAADDTTNGVGRFPLDLITINASHQWRYLSDGSDQGTAWRATAFDDSAWPSGAAILGVEGAGLPEPLRTQFTPYNNQIITYYFRTHFNYSGPSGNGLIQLRAVIDDGGAVYLNGVELYRLRLPANPGYLTVASGGPPVDPAQYEGPVTLCATNLQNGDNVIAVEVHQNATGSSDIVMGLEVKTLLSEITPVSFITQPMSVTVAEGGSATFSVVAAGTQVQYQWSGPGGPITDATNASLTINPALRTDEGNYVCEIYNSISGPTASDIVTLTIIEDLTAPTVDWAFSTNGFVVVSYSEATTGGDNAGNYTVTGADSSTIAVTAAAYVPAGGTGRVAILTLAAAPGMQGYTVTAANISDLYANAGGGSTAIAIFSSSAMAINASWRYNDTGTDLGSGWEATGFDDSAWALGAGLFDGVRNGNIPPGSHCRDLVNAIPVGTCIRISNATDTAQIPSAYFRTHFNFSGNPTGAVVCLRPVVDDGVVFYLNGVELTRVGMPTGAVTFATLATGRAAAVGTANYEGPFYTCPTNLVVGDNVLAASAHQFNLTSSDLTFGVEASVLEITPPISISIVLNVDGSVTLTWAGGGSLISSADVTAPRATWPVVGGATSPHTIPAGSLAAHRFYSVRVP